MEHLFQIADNNMYQNKLLSVGSIRSTFVNTFMKALEAKDYVSEGHVSRMEEMAIKMGNALNLSQAEIDRLVFDKIP
jgi:HD-GYP domain-containing protein (c-di-GMP phosphodiesterase class II)